MERTCGELDTISTCSNSASFVDSKRERYLTSSGWVVSGHLSEVGVVLYYIRSQVSPRFLLRQFVSTSFDSIMPLELGCRTYASHGRTLQRC